MNPLWIVIASKPALDKVTGDRATQIEAMYRRPDAAPLPALPDSPSRFETLRDHGGSLVARMRRVTDLSRRDPVRTRSDGPTES